MTCSRSGAAACRQPLSSGFPDHHAAKTAAAASASEAAGFRSRGAASHRPFGDTKVQ
jgi:hypothetical protein